MDITVNKRPLAQSKGARKIRARQGYIPGSVYGRGLPPFNVEVPTRAIAQVLTAETGMNTIINLSVAGEPNTHTVMMDNLQRDPISRGFVTVGFHEVQGGDKVTAHVPITLVGTPAAVASNEAMLEQTLETITVHAAPGDIPAHLDVDVSGLNVGDVLHVSHLPHNPKLTFSVPEDTAIAAVHANRVSDAASPTDALSGQDAVTELRGGSNPANDSITGQQ